ncbi:MAG: DUF748 domain-containing protein, partial [Gammaproteobacteria bacterium]|nr:DUF748 domain-containing protein [Gammaproteobacteria bacterium]
MALNRLELARGRATFEDRTVKPPVKVTLRNMSLTGTQLGTAEDSQGEISFRTTVNRAGAVSLQGRISPTLTGTLAVVANRIDLVPFKPYVAPHTRADLTSGSVATRGSVTIRRDKDLQVDLQGRGRGLRACAAPPGRRRRSAQVEIAPPHRRRCRVRAAPGRRRRDRADGLLCTARPGREWPAQLAGPCRDRAGAT